MTFKNFFKDIYRVIIFTLYPLSQLYEYFVFIGIHCLTQKKNEGLFVDILLVIYHLLTISIVIYAMKIVFFEGSSTKERFPNVPEDNRRLYHKNLNIFLQREALKYRSARVHICSICKTYKPPRAHHCSTCNKCYLKYDHHSLMLDTCIAFHNYKYYFQFLCLNLIQSFLFLISISMDLFKVKNMTIKINYQISIVLILCKLVLFSYLIIYNILLISNNETTVERIAIRNYINSNYKLVDIFQEGPITQFSTSKDKKILNPYNLSTRENWEHIFGYRLVEWILPLDSSIGDGISFKKNYIEYEWL